MPCDSRGTCDERGGQCRRHDIQRLSRVAPHLGAPRNLEDHGPTFDARLRVLLQEVDGLDGVRVTHVVVTILDFVAIRTHVVFAQVALPPARQKPSTVRHGALSDKRLLLFTGGGGPVFFWMTEHEYLALQLIIECVSAHCRGSLREPDAPARVSFPNYGCADTECPSLSSACE